MPAESDTASRRGLSFITPHTCLLAARRVFPIRAPARQAVSNRDTANPTKARMSLAKAADEEEKLFREYLPADGPYLKKVDKNGKTIQVCVAVPAALFAPLRRRAAVAAATTANCRARSS